MRSVFGPSFIVGIFLTTGVAFAQAQAPAANLVFVTASIEPSALIPVNAKQALARRVGVSFAGTQADFGFMTLRDLILYAYGVSSTQLNGPEWLAERPYDVVATMPAGTSTDDAPRMLQALLETRCKLAVHRESKSRQVMALAVAKGGPKLVESASVLPPARGTPVLHYDTAVVTKEGPVAIYLHGHEGSTLKASMTMPQFAGLLTNVLHAGDNRGRPYVDMHEYSGDWHTVLDQTGLKGTYEVAVDSSLPPDLVAQRLVGARAISIGGAVSQDMLENLGAPQPEDALDPAIFASVQRLGLNLELSKAKAEVLVIERVERPSEN
jgi:uncharacterized protein (TIGR03435 family)